jgi:hypothetical protein
MGYPRAEKKEELKNPRPQKRKVRKEKRRQKNGPN